MSIVERQGFKCALTGIEVTPKRSSLDHRHPRSYGGDDDKDNLQVVLPMIQRAKTTMSQRQFVSMCHAVARHCPDCGDTTWVDGLVDDGPIAE
jgi:5-methylcytosine-specific restriction endonuclease McrA